MSPLRMMTKEEAAVFARWEQSERPYPWTKTHFLETQTSDNQVSLVLEDEGEAIAFAVVQVLDEEAHLLNFMVTPRVRRRGWGKKFLEQVLDWARQSGASRIFLDVDPNNIGAVGLYTKAGFVERERRKKSYPHGEDALIMSRDL